jgi:hypothetical protein
MRAPLLLVAATLMFPLAGCGNKSGLKTFTSKEGKFSILMPGTPKMDVTPLAPGFDATHYTSNTKDPVYMVSFGPVNPQGTPDLRAAVQGLTTDAGGRILVERGFQIGGSTGIEFEGEIPDPKCFVAGRVFIQNGRLYRITMAGTNSRLANADVQKFLNSFQLTY